MNQTKKLLLSLAAGTLVAACTETNATDPQTSNPVASPSNPPASTAAQSPVETTTSLDEDTLASVNGESISTQEFAVFFQERTKGRLKTQPTPQMQGAIFGDMINVYVLAHEAETSGLSETPNVKAGLKVHRKEFLARVAMADFANKYTPDDAQIQALYDEKIAKAPKTEYKARHILLKTEEDAVAVIGELDGGADFAELAKTRSTGPSGPKGGDLGWFAEGQMVAPFFEAVQGMEKGSYSKKPVQTQFGWHVILLEDTRPTEQPSLDAMKPKLVEELKQQALRDHLSALQSSAEIQINKQFAQADQSAADKADAPAADTGPGSGAPKE